MVLLHRILLFLECSQKKINHFLVTSQHNLAMPGSVLLIDFILPPQVYLGYQSVQIPLEKDQKYTPSSYYSMTVKLVQHPMQQIYVLGKPRIRILLDSFIQQNMRLSQAINEVVER